MIGATGGRTELEARVVRYADLVPCYNAFIDTRTPGSERKENFTIIGPGVSENSTQHVHIAEPHGFNIGGARQPPGCVNSQHSHETAEIFVVHSGRWRFDFGEHGEDASIEAGAGDILSFPVHTFRGFTNIGDGDEPGFLWAVLGGDDPGRVTWAPKVFDLAERYGLVLLETGALVDTVAGERVPEGVRPMPVTSRETIAALRRVQPHDAPQIVARAKWSGRTGITPLIGGGGPLPPVEGFSVSRLEIAPGENTELRSSGAPEVAFVHEGELMVEAESGTVRLGPGDTITIPRGETRRYIAETAVAAFIVQGNEPRT